MNNVKMCERCNAVIISNLHEASADYYRHLSVKYCDSCREITNHEKNAERCRKYRERKRAERNGIQTAEQTQLDILRMENSKLMQDYFEICQVIEKLKAEIYRMKYLEVRPDQREQERKII